VVGVFNSNNTPNPPTYQLFLQALNQGGDISSTFFLGTYTFSPTPRVFTFSQNAGVCDGYFNGVYVSSFNMSNYPPPPNTNVNIGFTNNSTKYQYFRGTVNQIQYYNRALTPLEVRQNFNAIRGRFNI
jgi:hypothetical protein